MTSTTTQSSVAGHEAESPTERTLADRFAAGLEQGRRMRVLQANPAFRHLADAAWTARKDIERLSRILGTIWELTDGYGEESNAEPSLPGHETAIVAGIGVMVTEQLDAITETLEERCQAAFKILDGYTDSATPVPAGSEQDSASIANREASPTADGYHLPRVGSRVQFCTGMGRDDCLCRYGRVVDTSSFAALCEEDKTGKRFTVPTGPNLLLLTTPVTDGDQEGEGDGN